MKIDEIRAMNDLLNGVVGEYFVKQIQRHIMKVSRHILCPISEYYYKTLKEIVLWVSNGVSPRDISEALKHREERYSGKISNDKHTA